MWFIHQKRWNSVFGIQMYHLQCIIKHTSFQSFTSLNKVLFLCHCNKLYDFLVMRFIWKKWLWGLYFWAQQMYAVLEFMQPLL